MRHLVRSVAVLACAAAFSLGANAQTVNLKMQATWPASLTLYENFTYFVDRVSKISGGTLKIEAMPAGQVVPAFEVLDATHKKVLDGAHSWSGYWVGKNKAAILCTGGPGGTFGMDMIDALGWMYHGGGLALMREFFKDYNIISFPAGNTNAQMGGWFRKEIKTVNDLKGLKMRIGGTGGLPLAKLGVVPQQIPGGDIYPALEKGTIDAAEWVGPYDDEKLGFYKVAKNYYYPGWWEGGPEIDAFVNIKAWEALPKDYQAIFEAACYEANIDMAAKYDALNPAALKRLIGNGVKLQPFSNDIMAACYKATTETYDEIATKNAKFKKVYEPWKKFREDQVSWFAVAENRFDNFMIAAERLSRKK